MILINPDIEIDKSKLPKLLQDIIKQLEEYEKEGKWIMYDGLFEALEANSKNFLLDDKITEKQFDLLMKKYGGYV